MKEFMDIINKRYPKYGFLLSHYHTLNIDEDDIGNGDCTCMHIYNIKYYHKDIGKSIIFTVKYSPINNNNNAYQFAYVPTTNKDMSKWLECLDNHFRNKPK